MKAGPAPTAPARSRRAPGQRRGSAAARFAAALVVPALAVVAAAHAYLDASQPAANAVVAGPVTAVTLTFSERVEVAFSSFKVYAFEAAVDMTADDADMRLNALAALVVSEFNGTTTDGDGLVPSSSASPAGDTSTVVLTLEEPLPPGHYVVMWRVLSADTHVLDGHVVFTVAD